MTQDDRRTMQCPITEVTVYLRGAQVTRSGLVPVEAGDNLLVLEELPAEFMPDSIQAASESEAAILSVEHAINHMRRAGQTRRVEELSAKLRELQDKQEITQSQAEVCEAEEEMLNANRELGGSHTGLQAAELREAVLFYHERMAEIKRRQLALRKEAETRGEDIQRLQNELGTLAKTDAQPVSEITLRIAAPEKGEIPLTVSYFVRKAGWTPLYDLRANDIQSGLQLTCKASVHQNTGEEWENVYLTVSTGSPAANATSPELRPWYLQARPQPQARRAANNFQSFSPLMEESVDELRMAAPEPAPEERERGIAVPRVEEQATSVEYVIPAPCAISAGKGQQTVEIASHMLDAHFQYQSVRKLDKDVYLVAKVRDYARLNLIAGEANIFFAKKYVGRTTIDPRRATDEMTFSLGADKSVIVTRVKGKSFSANTMMGGGIKSTREWELTARNLKSHKVELKLMDQIPVSLNKQIQVEAQELSGAELEEDTGTLVWIFDLEPAESRSVAVRYTVTHPKDMPVLLD